MELESKNKSREDGMMRSKSSDTREMRDRPQASRVKRFPIFWMGIIKQTSR